MADRYQGLTSMTAVENPLEWLDISEDFEVSPHWLDATNSVADRDPVGSENFCQIRKKSFQIRIQAARTRNENETKLLKLTIYILQMQS